MYQGEQLPFGSSPYEVMLKLGTLIPWLSNRFTITVFHGYEILGVGNPICSANIHKTHLYSEMTSVRPSNSIFFSHNMAVMYQPFSGRYPPVTNCLDARDGPGWSPSKTYQMVVSKPHVHTYPKYTNIYIYIYRIPHIWEYPNHPVIYIYMYIPILCLVFRIRSDQVAQQDAERQKFIVEKADVFLFMGCATWWLHWVNGWYIYKSLVNIGKWLLNLVECELIVK